MKPWDEMTARERDALVAEKVFGVDVKWHDALVRDADGFIATEWVPVDGKGRTILPYTTDIAATWKVVEQVRADGWWWSVCNLIDTPGMEWRAEVRDPNRMWEAQAHHVAVGATLPDSICLAALRAKGVL